MNASASRAMAACFMIVGLAACTQADPPPPERAGGIVDLGESIEWAAVEGAVEYRVQLWDGVRLLFEEAREQPSLPVTTVMERSLLGVTRAELQVRAFGPDGHQIGAVQRRTYPAGAG